MTRIGLLAAPLLMALAGCTASRTWTEDVQLLDGRVIQVTQSRKYDRVATSFGGDLIPRDCWLTADLAIGSGRISWHEALVPMVLNQFRGSWYLIAMPPTIVEHRKYGSPVPGYVAFRLSGRAWRRVPLDSVPAAVYRTNLLIPHAPPGDSERISLEDKKLANSDPRYPAWTTRVDPSWKPIE